MLQVGDCFLYDDELYIKIDGRFSDNYAVCAIYLKNGHKNGFSNAIEVEPVTVVATIEN